MALPLVARRFVPFADGSWRDLATGCRVWLRRCGVPPHERLALDETAGRLANFSHPALAPYLDYGPLGEHEWFEACALEHPDSHGYTAGAEDAATLVARIGPCRVRLLTVGATGARVPSLLAEDVEDTSDEAVIARHCVPGIWIQPRPLVQRLLARLDDVRESGVVVWEIHAEKGSGWRTCWREMARELRRRGYLALCAPVLTGGSPGDPRTHPAWLAEIPAATLVVAGSWAATPTATDALAGLVIALGARGVPAVILNVRPGEPKAGADSLEPLSAGVLASAVVGVPQRISDRRVLGMAARARGLPGIFVRALHRASLEPSDALQVHDGGAAGTPALRVSQLSALAAGRARSLCIKGRPGAARWLLRREATRLQRRGDRSSAVKVWAELAVSSARAGRHPEAERSWREAWKATETHSDIGGIVEATPRLAAAWLTDLALVPAETLLRSALEATTLTARSDATVRCLLAEVLWWQARWRECLAIVDGVGSASARAVSARAHLALDDPSRALQQAVAASDEAAQSRVVADRLSALEARVQVAVALGDREQADRSLHELASLLDLDDVQTACRNLIVAEASVATGEPMTAALHATLRALIVRRAPRLLRARARLVLCLARTDRRELEREVQRVALASGARALLPGQRAFPWPWRRARSLPRSPMVHDIVDILRACHEESEPSAALQRLCTLVAERATAAGVSVSVCVGGSLVMLARAGRPPSPGLATRADALGAAIGPELSADGMEGGWPVRHGSDAIGVLACRWNTTQAPSSDALAIVQTAAAAMATVVALAGAAREARAAQPGHHELIGSSAAMSSVRAAIDRAAPSPFPVLIEGESGAGKELVARAIHANSARRGRRFAAFNCAALADDLIEAELFGHARGAFTGAIAERAGLFEEADGGTLFLDEVGELSARAQAKLLRVIQEGEIRRVGESRPRRVDTRIVAATNRSLAAEVAAGRFRTDLRFRLDVIRIDVPPLRVRPEDVCELAVHFWRDAVARVGSRAVLGREALAALARYEWPGNVRELQNVLSALAVTAPHRGTVGAAALPRGIAPSTGDGLTLGEARRQFDATFVRSALARAGGCRSRAASELGVSRQGLAKLMERLGIDAQNESVDA